MSGQPHNKPLQLTGYSEPQLDAVASGRYRAAAAGRSGGRQLSGISVRRLEPMASKKFCTQCGVSILATTFDKNNRRCIPCTTGLREEWAAAARRGPPTIKFAPNDEIEALRPFVDEFWANVLGTPYATSFVSNECTLEAWEHYVGGRERLVALVEQKYGVDISSHYEEPIPRVLRRIRDRAV